MLEAKTTSSLYRHTLEQLLPRWVYFCTPPYGTREETPEPNPEGGLAHQATLPGVRGQGKGRTKKKRTQPNKNDSPVNYLRTCWDGAKT